MVAARHTITRNVNLAEHVFSDWLEIIIEHVDLRVSSGRADWYESLRVFVWIEAVNHTAGSCLRWSILVDDLDISIEASQHFIRQVGFKLFATDN